ncbi:MAG: response regulator [Methanomicrobiales archaeon]|nr:response regulator [Methanomicrobiales archaeon]
MGETKILVVEDEAITGMDIRRSLTEMGYSVVAIATTGELAVRKAGELRPDLILMDIMLAGRMNGIEAAAVIKNELRIPVVYLSAYSDDSYLAKAKLTEPFGYILKPFRELELKTTIEMALYKHSMEHALRISEATTRVLLNATDDILFLVDTNGRLLASNDSLAKKTRKPVRDLTGTNISSLVEQGILSNRMAGWNVNITTKKPEHFEEEFKGTWYDTAIYPVLNPAGEVVLFAVYIRNISESRKSAEQARHNEEFFRSLIEDTSDVIAILNADGTIRHESPSINRTLGYAAEELVNTSLYSIIPEEETKKARVIFESILENPGMVKPIRLVLKKKDGSTCIMEGIISNLNGNPVIDGIVLNGWIKKE